MPIVMVSALLPGRQNVILYFLKLIAVEATIMPLIVFFFWMSVVFIAALGTDALNYYGATNLLDVFVKLSIAWMFVTLSWKTRGMLETAFGVKGGNLFGPAKK